MGIHPLYLRLRPTVINCTKTHGPKATLSQRIVGDIQQLLRVASEQGSSVSLSDLEPMFMALLETSDALVEECSQHP